MSRENSKEEIQEFLKKALVDAPDWVTAGEVNLVNRTCEKLSTGEALDINEVMVVRTADYMITAEKEAE